MRKAGFYWVKICDDWQWQVVEWVCENGGYFLIHGEDGAFTESEIDEIYETRILTPDEQAEEDFQNKADNEH